MVYLPKDASRPRQVEAQKARENRREIVKALSGGEVSRRDLYKWGLFTLTGALALKNGFSPFAQRAIAAVPTGTPRSPFFGEKKFGYALNRLDLQQPVPLKRTQKEVIDANGNSKMEFVAEFPGDLNEPDAHRLSYHTDYNVVKAQGKSNKDNPYTNP